MLQFSLIKSLVRLSIVIMILTLVACGNTSQPKSITGRNANATNAATRNTSISTATATIPPSPTVDTGENPVHLLIPAVGISADIEQVSLGSNGDLATPAKNPWTDAGWYNLGPQPGEQGSAVIDGHLDRPGGYPAVFWYLRNVVAGDDILVKNAAGKTLSFRVTRIAYYAPQQAPLQDIFGNQGGVYLNLITCAGDWIPSQHQTTLRLVVYTVLA